MKYTFVGQLSFAIFQFFLVFFILRNEGVNVLGYYGLFVSVLNPLQQFFKFGIPKLINTSDSLIDQKKYLIISFYTVLLFLVFGLFSVFFIDINEFSHLFLSLLFFKSLINLRDSQHSIYTRNKLFKLFFNSSFYCNSLLILFFWIVYHYTKSITSSFTVSGIIICSFIVFDFIKIIKLFKVDLYELWDFSYLKKHFLKLIKMSLSNFVFNLKSNLPRYILAANFSISFVGVYTAIFQVVSVLEIMNQSILKFNYSKLTEFFRDNIVKFKKVEKEIYVNTSIIVLISLIINYLIGERLLGYFLGEEFKNYLVILLILIFDRYFAMINSIPKTIFILKNKVQYNILSTSVILVISFLCLSNIKNFAYFNLALVILSCVQFLINKLILSKV